MAKLLYGLGYTERPDFVEAHRMDIIGPHIGHTEEKMKKLIDQARGGVLFLDEAYSLASEDNSNDFGQEAINILVKAMEDYREDLVVILAGYQTEMEKLFLMNEGLRSRIAYRFHFPDYKEEELADLAVRLIKELGYQQLPGCKEAVLSVIKRVSYQGTVKGNARFIRDFVDRIIKFHNVRVGQATTDHGIGIIKKEDILKAGGMKLPDQRDGRQQQLIDEAMSELKNLVGLASVKGEIKRIKQFLESEQGEYGQVPVNLHMTFTGSPGTGKTTVARIIGKLFNGLGVLENGHFTEVGRSDLVGKYIGQTAPKVKDVVARARGGVLFVDEAYALASASPGDFGNEAISTLIQEMENHRGSFILILAGYKGEMNHLLAQNPGFRSRVPFQVDFPDYSLSELVDITDIHLKRYNKQLADDSKALLLSLLEKERIQGNGRWVRNFAEQLHMENSLRKTKANPKGVSFVGMEDVANALKRVI